ncbi:hypothetical protein [Alloactinosynnema sp. L-07]|uniref:hypothetical protein n=1 Tax=Alloactinosynnema sp. L-07 TaxID=1653480 RepID=UPI00065EF077|nr:hypothetical protein [Alloactinosynnema sp. L-07]CRK56011.1 hypothetical protein [Alloactinosynnema sp. L-07]
MAEPALSNRLTKLDVTARMWETVFPMLSGLGVVLIGLLVILGGWLGDMSVFGGMLVVAGGLWVVLKAVRVLLMTLRMRRILRVEPWEERRVDYYHTHVFYTRQAWVWTRSKPEEVLWVRLLPLEKRPLVRVGVAETMWFAGSGEWRVVSPEGGGTTRLARKAVPGDALFGRIVGMTPGGAKRADKLMRAMQRDAE